MQDKTILLVGGIACLSLAALVTVLYLRSKARTVQTLADVTDEQLTVVQLNGSDLAEWFKRKNPNGQYTNLVVQWNGEQTPGTSNLSEETRKSLDSAMRDFGKGLIQVIATKDGETIISCRAVQYEMLGKSLDKLLKDNGGVFIVD